MRRRHQVAGVLALATSLLLLNAVPAAADPVQDKLAGFLKETLTPGIALSAMREGDAAPRNWYAGLANVELNVPVDARTTFRIGSVTKLFTAAAVMKLAREGKLEMDAKLAPYFPEVQAASDITLTELLDHSSGLPDMIFVEPFASNMAKPYTPGEILSMVSKQGTLDFQPGRSSEYSNTGYLLLGLLVEKVSGLSYDDFVQRNVVGPLGMHDTALGSDSAIVPWRAAGYGIQTKAGVKPRLANAEWVSIIPPFSSGAMLSRPSDFIRLIDLDRLLGVDTVRAMVQTGRAPNSSKPHPAFPGGPELSIRYGLGFELVRFSDSTETLVAKDGVIPGFSSWYVYFPGRKLAVAASVNNDAAVIPLLLLIRDVAACL